MTEVKQYWRCTTETGRVYVIDDFGVVRHEDSGSYRFRSWYVYDREAMKPYPGEPYKPIVGKALYCYNFSDWQLSTNLVKVEELND